MKPYERYVQEATGSKQSSSGQAQVSNRHRLLEGSHDEIKNQASINFSSYTESKSQRSKTSPPRQNQVVNKSIGQKLLIDKQKHLYQKQHVEEAAVSPMSKHQIKKMLLPEIYKLGPPPKKDKYRMKNEDLRGLDPSKSKDEDGSNERSHETPVHRMELADEQELTMNLVHKQNEGNRSAVVSAATPRTALLKSP